MCHWRSVRYETAATTMTATITDISNTAIPSGTVRMSRAKPLIAIAAETTGPRSAAPTRTFTPPFP